MKINFLPNAYAVNSRVELENGLRIQIEGCLEQVSSDVMTRDDT